MAPGSSNTYFPTMRLLINTKLNYILFSPDVNFYTGQPINGRTVMYYLLYNPFHSKEFQNYYKNLLEISGESINSGYQKFKNDLTPTVQSASESAHFGSVPALTCAFDSFET